jgi:hypothetical protein
VYLRRFRHPAGGTSYICAPSWKTLESSELDAIAATGSSSIVTRQFARCEGLSNRTSSRKASGYSYGCAGCAVPFRVVSLVTNVTLMVNSRFITDR